MRDLKIIETGSGGDCIFTEIDLKTINGFENMPYLAMFGGNTASNTTEREIGQQAFDFWGNTLFSKNESAKQFNSNTERVLQSVALNSAGRGEILAAVESDLFFMKEFADVKSSVVIKEKDKVLISIILKKPENLESKEYNFIWDSTLQELSFEA